MHRLTIPGKPITKKTSQQIIRVKGRMRLVPSKATKTWEIGATMLLQGQWKGRPPLLGLIALDVKVYRGVEIGDLTNYLNAIGDVLQAARVIGNDRQIQTIHAWNLLDRAKPRVEIDLWELAS